MMKYPYNRLDQIKSLVSLPVLVGKKVSAILSLHSKQTYTFDISSVKRLNFLLDRCHWFLHALYLQEERNQERQAWEGTMLHEIRSELNPLKHHISQALGSVEPGDIDSSLHNAQHLIEELSVLANNFMDISGNVQADFYSITEKPIFFVEKFLQNHIETTKAKNQTFSFLTPKEADEWLVSLQGEEEMFAQVIRNILHNAIKYGGDNAEILITVNTEFHKDKCCWHFTVSNPGQMTPEENRLKFVPRAFPSDRREGLPDGAHVGLAASRNAH